MSGLRTRKIGIPKPKQPDQDCKIPITNYAGNKIAGHTFYRVRCNRGCCRQCECGHVMLSSEYAETHVDNLSKRKTA